ncbi:MAG: leucine-rich repeat domain-containing protein, partial [Alistipes sp.]|nr:leucine-rich repeat domain-containing protein [Alistipes sp.]
MKKLYSLFVLAALLLSYSCTHVIYFDKTPVEEPEDEFVVPEGATVIYYTTTDGKTIQAGVTKIPNVLSNTYKNGEGRIIIKGTVEEIPEKAFNNFTTLKSITLPNGVKTIGNNAFNGCNHLISVTIADSVTSIEYGAFQNCTSLTSVTIPNSVTSIGKQTFYYCKNLTDVIIGNGVTSIGYQAFDYCDAITDVYISDLIAWCNIDFASRSSNPVDNIATLYLNGTTVTELVIPDEIENIKANAFCGCSSITSVFIPHTVTSIAKDAFFNCNNLKEIYCTSA